MILRPPSHVRVPAILLPLVVPWVAAAQQQQRHRAQPQLPRAQQQLPRAQAQLPRAQAQLPRAQQPLPQAQQQLRQAVLMFLAQLQPMSERLQTATQCHGTSTRQPMRTIAFCLLLTAVETARFISYSTALV
jgi:hypothetical protein